MIVFLVLTDGRIDCLAQTIESLDRQITTSHLVRRVIWDDTGNDDHYAYLCRTYPKWMAQRAVQTAREGFGGAIRSAWQRTAALRPDYVLHCEDDFVFERPVDLDAITAVLDSRPYLAQMALRRQGWNAAEIAAGGVVELHPDAYVAHYVSRRDPDGPGKYLRQWLEHRLFWTTNPSLFRSDVLAVGWPEGEHSEGVFTHRLLDGGFGDEAADQVRFGYWGDRQSGTWVRHIGTTRVGCNY